MHFDKVRGVAVRLERRNWGLAGDQKANVGAISSASGAFDENVPHQ